MSHRRSFGLARRPAGRATALLSLVLVARLICPPAFAATGQVAYFASVADAPALVAVQLLQPAGEQPLVTAVTALLAGPPTGAPLVTMTPAGTRLLAATVKNGVATVDLSREALQANVGSLGEALLLASLVNTAGQYASVDLVQLLVEGQRVETIAGHIGAALPLAPEHTFDLHGFTDCGDHWAERQIVAMSLRGVISGYDDDTFRPDRPISRAEAIKLVAAVSGPADYQLPVSSFADVGKGYPLAAWIETAVQRGIVRPADYRSADGSLRLNPDGACTRREAAVMLTRASGAEPRAVVLTGGQTPWQDVATQPAWATGYFLAAAERELMQGFPDGSFRPNATLTRAEAATVVARLAGCWPAARLCSAVAPNAGCGSGLFVAGAAPTDATLTLELGNAQGRQLAVHALTLNRCSPRTAYYAALLPAGGLPAGATTARVVARSGGAVVASWQTSLGGT